ncbi:hypothetical protein [Nocardiopsis ansamitocini]|uniref:Uncharacterized protein n=1 Tax=Nocardiopsis ansamitocini TaxID=1670832 RepID=A0A9W6PAU6_9ACTN|nr:hypothetical protein [Nocardiopsis ansamitocini]GLU50137.1 hypothetical protein Nans01_44880 [Nocardiopsis ansamitocini]
MSNSISGKVVRILSEREMLINKGEEDGVDLDFVFVVLPKEIEVIEDPDTGEKLGGMRKVKLPLRVVKVSARMALLRTYRSETVNVGGSGVAISQLFSSPKWEKRVERINSGVDFEDDDIEPGDPVILVEGGAAEVPSVLFVDEEN